jgi:hypothetical protein
MSANQRIFFGDVQSIDESGCPGLMVASESVSSKKLLRLFARQSNKNTVSVIV